MLFFMGAVVSGIAVYLAALHWGSGGTLFTVALLIGGGLWLVFYGLSESSLPFGVGATVAIGLGMVISTFVTAVVVAAVHERKLRALERSARPD